MIYIYITLFIMLIPVFIFFYNFFKKFIKTFNKNLKENKIKLFSLIISSILFILSFNLKIFLIIIHFIFISLLIDLILYILKKLKINTNKIKGLTSTGIIPLILTIIIITYGYFNMTNIKETNYEIYTNKNLNNQYKVIFISDLHYKTTMNQKSLLDITKKVNKLSPDIVILGGDIIDEQTKNKDMKEVFSTLGNLQSKYGTFFIYGNHDNSNYKIDNKEYTKEELINEIEKNNIKILKDKTYEINNELVLIGRENAQEKRKTSLELLENIDKEKFLLLIDHMPTDLNENEKNGYDLQLSGHTHAGQIFPAGLLIDIFGDISYGYRKIKDFDVIVSSGIGGWNFKFRTSKHSEYVVIDIKNSSN